MITVVKKFIPKSAGSWMLWIAVLIGLVVAYRMIAKEIRLARQRSVRSQNTASEEIVPSALSFSNAEFSILAERFYGAFHRWIGYNFDTVQTVLKSLKNASDFYKLIEVYGVRDISPTTFINQSYGLIEVMENQLSDSDLEKVSKILKTINVNF